MRPRLGPNGSKWNTGWLAKELTSGRSEWRPPDSSLILDIWPKLQKMTGRSEFPHCIVGNLFIGDSHSAFARIENHYFINEVLRTGYLIEILKYS